MDKKNNFLMYVISNVTVLKKMHLIFMPVIIKTNFSSAYVWMWNVPTYFEEFRITRTR
jgi:hypothetical protein